MLINATKTSIKDSVVESITDSGNAGLTLSLKAPDGTCITLLVSGICKVLNAQSAVQMVKEKQELLKTNCFENWD